MRPVTVSVGPLAAASATNIRTASSATGLLVLNGTLVSTGSSFYPIPGGNGQKIAVPSGAVLLDSPRQVLFTNASGETGKTIAVTGLDRAGNLQSETVTLAGAGSTATALSYSVLLTATISSASAGNISVGTNAVSESAWVRLDDWGFNTVGIQVDVTGTVNYTVYETLDDPNSPTNPVVPASMKWFQSNDATVVGATVSAQSNFGFLPTYAKVVLNSGTGSLTANFAQNAGVP